MTVSALTRNHITLRGNVNSTQTIVFAHGFGTDQTAWRFVQGAFEADYRLVLYDNVGGGKADPEAYNPSRYSMLDAYANDLLDICDDLNLQNPILVAHSVSGMIGLLSANKAPDLFSKLVFIGASPRYLNDVDYYGGFEQSDLDSLYTTMSTNYYAWASGFASLAMGNPEQPNLALEFSSTLADIRPDIAQAVSRVIFQSDFRSELAKLQTKTLILQAKQDIAVPTEVGRYLSRHIPRNQYREVNATGHFPHMSAPKEIIAAIQPFLSL